MEVNRVRQIIGVMRLAPETQDFCEVGNLVKKKLVRLKTARLELGLDTIQPVAPVNQHPPMHHPLDGCHHSVGDESQLS